MIGMCLLCCAKASFIGEITPEWALYVGTKDHEDWPVGQYGLVNMNDPTFVFAGPLLCVPPEDVDAATKNAFSDRVRDLEQALVCDPLTGWSLVESAHRCGYDHIRHGRFARWLLDRMGTVAAR